MKHPLALFLNALSASSGLHAAAREGEDIARLLALKVYEVDCYDDNATALYEATLCNKPASILTLLKHKANPNLTSTNVISSKPEKIIQVSIEQANTSNIKLLIMYGADDLGLKFVNSRDDIEKLFYKTRGIKEQYDAHLKMADAEWLNKRYSRALSNYQKAADIWYTLSQDEPVARYQKHYKKQALLFYKKAISCYEKLSAQEITAEAKIYSSKSAHLNISQHRQANTEQTAHSTLGLYQRKPNRQKQNEEQEPLLDIAYTP